MILTKSDFFTLKEIKKIQEELDPYIKTVIDVETKVCSAGCNRHFESEKILLDSGSQQNNLWGGGIDTESKTIDFNSLINIRPQINTSNEIQDLQIRKKFEELSRYFFKMLYE